MASTLVLLLQLLLVSLASASHFFGGTVTFAYKGRNPDGTFRVDLRNRATFDGCQYQLYWYCYSGNCGSNPRNERGVLDRSTNAPRYNNQWCETEKVSTRNVQSDKPFQMRANSCCWIPTRNQVINWLLLTSVDLGSRSDTGKPNRSPDIAILPFLRVPQNCPRTYKLMSFDPDGDKVRCRFGTDRYRECSTCNQPSGFVLDENSCTLHYVQSYADPRVYGFELVVEDFPQWHITLAYTDGSRSYRAPLTPSPTTTTATTTCMTTTPHWHTGTTRMTTTPYWRSRTTRMTTTPYWHTGTTRMTTTSHWRSRTTRMTTTPYWHTGTTRMTTTPYWRSRTTRMTTTPYWRSRTTRMTTTPYWHTGTTRMTTTPYWHTGTTRMTTTPYWHTGTTRMTTTPYWRSRTTRMTTTPYWHTGTTRMTTTPYWRSRTTRMTTTPYWHTGTTRMTTTPYWRFRAKRMAYTPQWRSGTTRMTTTPHWRSGTTRMTTTPHWRTGTTRMTTTPHWHTGTTRMTTTPHWHTGTTRMTTTPHWHTGSTTPSSTTTTATTTRMTTTPHWHSTSTMTTDTTPLSKLPLQFSFLVDPPAPSCQEGHYLPKFLHPTPENGARLQAEVNKEVEIRVKAQATYATIHDIIISGPLNITKHKTTHDEFVIRWTPIADDLGDYYPICFAVESVTGSATIHTTTYNYHGHYHATPSSQSGIYQSEMRCVLLEIQKKQVNSHVSCNESSMTVEIEKSSLPRGIHEDHLQLSDPTNTVCSFQTHSNSTHAIAVIPLNACGTQIEEDDDNLIFKNEITTVDNVKDLITRKSQLEVKFDCQYPKRGNVTRSFTAHRHSVIVWEKGFGKFTYQFEFYPDGSFRTMTDPNSYPLEYDIGDRIYMQIEATSTVNNTELFVESCRASPYDSPNYQPTYSIIDNGCEVDSTVVIYSPAHKTQFRFSLEAFAFIGLHNQVYISCSVLMCEAGSHGTRCSKGCMTTAWPSSLSHHHRKREAVTQSARHFISQGPLRLRRSAESTGNPAINLNLNLVFIAGCLLAVVAMISTVVIYKARISKVKYQPLPTFET